MKLEVLIKHYLISQQAEGLSGYTIVWTLTSDD